jgi:predicted O-methyltransferase YrrM
MTRPDDWHPEIAGWSGDIHPFYAHMAKELGPRANVVEVGVYHGRSILFLAEKLLEEGKPDVRLFAVDPHDWADGWSDAGAFYHHLVMMPDRIVRMVRPLRFTRDVARAFADRSLDLVFIDGEHDEASVETDIDAWACKVRSGGILAGHDYGNPESPGVRQAVNGFADAGALHIESTVWWMRR